MAWLIATGVYSIYASKNQTVLLQEKLNTQSAAALRLISQRADQHDAHLTNLSALAQVLNNENKSLFYQVTTAIQTFYPRITNIELISLFDNGQSLSTRTSEAEQSRLNPLIRDSAKESSGQLIVKPSPLSSTHYLLIKRSPNTDQARYGLALEIDVQQLIGNDIAFWKNANTSLSLSFQDGKPLTTRSDKLTGNGGLNNAISYRSTLGSRSQPFDLYSELTTSFSEQYPIWRIAITSLFLAIASLIGHVVVNSMAKTRAAEQRARLGEQDARISHASRVNALGEMASGMAHELTQPLTSILSQSQAGLHMLNSENVDIPAARKVLETNIAQSKRAAGIIKRLRTWTRKTEVNYSIQDVSQCVENVLLLIDGDARRLGISITSDFRSAHTQVWGDSIEIEQVIFNLVRNALESFENSDYRADSPTIQLVVTNNATDVILTIEDNGKGISEDIINRLYEPFATNKENGTGLGLALCSRIIERMNGQIEIKNRNESGVIATVTIPLNSVDGTPND